MLRHASRLLATVCAAASFLNPAAFAARETPVESGNREQIFHVGNGGEPQDLDHQTLTGVPEHKIVMALAEGLVMEDPKTLDPRPGVAETWEISPDGKTYTFHLRADAKWSNGDPVTANDFIRSFQRILTPALGAAYAYHLFYVEGAEDFHRGKLPDFAQTGFKAPDARTLVLQLRNPTPFLLRLMASHYSWWPVHIPTIEKFGGMTKRGTPWTRAGNFVGNGAFALKEWRPNQVLIVERSPTYWDRANVKLKQIRFYPTENLDTEERMFRTGQLHLTNELPAGKIDTYKRENPGVLRIEPYLGTYFYRFNTTKPPLNDVRVRKALSLAIDRERLVARVTRGGQQPALHYTPPGTAGYTSTARLTGTVEDAQRLLAEAGYPGGKDFPKVTLMFNTSENHLKIAETLQEMWRKNLGIEVALENQEWKVYIQNQHSMNYEISRSGWIADYVDPHVYLDMWTKDGGNNDTGWSKPEYDKLLGTALEAKTEAERFAIYDKLEHMLIDELPFLPIYFYTRVVLQQPSVKGLYPNLLDNHPYKFIWLEETPAP